MDFFSGTLRQQRVTILLITPHVKELLASYYDFQKNRQNSSAITAARKAKIDQFKAEAALAKSPDDESLSVAVADARVCAAEALELVAANVGNDKLAMFDLVELFLQDENYEKLLKVVAALYNTTPSVLDEEKGILEVVEMAIDALNNPILLRFFPQLRPLVQEMQSDTSPK